jgi:hypothetical protein
MGCNARKTNNKQTTSGSVELWMRIQFRKNGELTDMQNVSRSKMTLCLGGSSSYIKLQGLYLMVGQEIYIYGTRSFFMVLIKACLLTVPGQ